MQRVSHKPDCRPRIAITAGDPHGIGPEIIVKSLADLNLRKQARCFIFGPHGQLYRAAESCGLEPFWHRVRYEAGNDLPRSLAGLADSAAPDVIVIDISEPELETLGRDDPIISAPSACGGSVSLKAIEEAVSWAYATPHNGGGHTAAHAQPPLVDAVVTAPISKTSWAMAGMKRFPGHTELLASRTGARRHAMMFVAPKLRVVLATIHMPLLELGNVLTIGRVFDTIDLAHQSLVQDFGIADPRIAVCGLNPHASEGGLFGDEESRLIEPAIRLARDQEIDVTGPWPADTVFNAAIDGNFDLIVAMYHDQGTIPIKLLSRDQGVNMTLGLPIIRTSPDHGTAFDIAGTNSANPGSMIAAIGLALDIAKQRRTFQTTPEPQS
ncbi:MAG: 4-hydroxythreonine-4-phosphate dehydrogenase PdxA [Planctomycetes bacterium]|nr:4-hydroxythreonine-4-phosphate dehydrogenase PdxA [Planctomycetota bacterium]NOG52852.1 4-hydroxythreonine-4-phosphate dehydrogenase PdxA [Planctomycetota bacterium]